ncbi:MAG: phosphate transporter, inner rane subunit PstC [Frankiales bacterium]|nr:phosphate transporter, inner rane subunit PstC [Frankiales bacterium]
MTTNSESRAPAPARPSIAARVPGRRGDHLFAGLVRGAGLAIVVVLAGVAAFLVVKSLPAFNGQPNEITGTKSFASYAAPLLFGTVLSSAIALVIAVPLSVGVALFISHYAPRRIATALGHVIDLLAAIPSVVFGLWGVFWLAQQLKPVYAWFATHAGFIPLFKGPASATGRTMLTVGIVLAVMILPIMTAICREVFRQTPRLHEEAALALGATRWEMIRLTVLPYSRSAIVSAAMLGLGRALGETMAVAIVLSVGGGMSFNLISSSNPATIPASIALNFKESTGTGINTLIATGLVLFVLTFAVNASARAVLARRKDFSGANG